jgi:LemA protein
LAFEIGVAGLIIVVLAALAFFLLSLRARLVRMRNETVRALSNLEAQIKQRNDWIPTLIETCRGYMGSSDRVLMAVSDARNAFAKAKTLAERAACEQAMRQGLAALFQEVERHRDLRINNSLQKLRSRFAEMGREVDGNRDALNQAVEHYNRRLGTFPDSWMAAFMSLKPKSKFE